MKLIPTEIHGVTIVELERTSDDRGFFARTFDSKAFTNAGLAGHFVQASIARNTHAGTLRGLHYQRHPREECKLVRCTRGSLFDVAVDVRQKSPTFGKWIGVSLDANDQTALYLPAGCAHGYQTLEDDTEAEYLISEHYTPEFSRGVFYADPLIGITWPLEVTNISQRDRNWPTLERADL